MPVNTRTARRVADEVWIIVALLHREHPGPLDFTMDEIVERARKAHLAGKLRPSVYVHVVEHCVANRPPNRALLEKVVHGIQFITSLERAPI